MVLEVNEHALAHFAVRGDAAGDGDLAVLDVIGARLVARFGRGEFIGERVDALGAERGEFGLALFDQ